ncbi:hypothetical protein TESG_03902 [Trichophyton tonsurans CBS 112818]|uniref:Uncharacterized protein n=1 Tax=Trichophyton tonsurans (strain CBS 112818) TaxID=647933 RepID=F2RYR0_TRIT1|nr:hypothetical protein TESG_03902 [Trichophyton tonsurans CBS 112818]
MVCCEFKCLKDVWKQPYHMTALPRLSLVDRLDFGTRFTQRRTWCNQKCQVEASFGSAFRDLTPTKAMQVSSRVPPWHSSAALGTAPEALFHVCIQLLTPYSAIAYTEELATFLAFHCAARQKTPEVIGVSENCHLAGCGRQIM